MLNELRKLLPEYEITKNGNVFDFKITAKDGRIIHIPALLFKKDRRRLKEIAEQYKHYWREYA